MRRLAQGIGANALGQLVNTGLALVLVPIMASRWGLDRYGVWLMIATIPAYLLVSDLGFGKAAVVDMTMRAARGDREGAIATFQSIWLLVLVISAALISLIVLLCLLLPDWMFGKPGVVTAMAARLALIQMGAYGTLILSGMLFSGGFQASGNYPLEATMMALAWLVEGVSAIVVVLLGGGLVAVAASYLFWRLALIVAQAAMLRRIAPWLTFGFARATREDLRRLLAPATAMMAVPLANSLILQGTALAIGWASSTAQVPVFTTVRTLVRFGIQLTGIVTRATMPEFTIASSKGDRTLQLRIIVLVVATSALVLVPIALVLFAAGPTVVALWTHGMVRPSMPMIGLMTTMALFNGFWSPLSGLLIALNRQGLFTFRFVILAVLSVPLTYVLAGRFGATGGAIAMLSVDMLMCLIIARIFRRLFAPLRELMAVIPLAWDDGLRLYRRMRGS